MRKSATLQNSNRGKTGVINTGISRVLSWIFILAAAVTLFSPSPVRATTYTWDISTTGTGSDGSGTWSTSNSNWATNPSDTVWPGTTNNAVFGVGGTAGTVTVSGGVSANSITFNPVSSGNYTLTGGTITLTGSQITVNASATINSALAGSNGLYVNGTRTLTLGGANSSLSGPVTLSSGTLALTNASAAGTGTITLDDVNTGSSNTTLQLGVSGGTYSNAITVAGLGSGATTIQYTPGGGGILTTGIITLNGPATFSAPSLAGNFFFASNLSGTGTLTIGSTGGQRMLLNNNSADDNDSGFTGAIVVQSGAVLEPRAALSAAVGNTVTVNSGGELRIQFTNTAIGALNGAGVVDSVSGAATLTVGEGNASGTFSGVLKNNGATLTVTKVGTGTETLSGSNTYTGVTTISGGTLQLGDGVSNNGYLAGSITNNGALVFANPTAQASNNIISGTGAVTVAGPGGLTLTGVSTYSGTTNINAAQALTIGSGGQLGSGTYVGNIVDNGTFIYGSNLAQTISTGTISGSGSVIERGSGQLTLAGANTYSGGTTISSGTVNLTTSLSAAGSGTITLNDANTGAANTTLLLGVGGVTVTWPNAITVANQGTGTATIEYTPASGAFTWSTGTITLNGSATIFAPFLTSYSQFGSVLTGTGALTLGSTDGQRFILIQSESGFTGSITVASGAIFEPRNELAAANGNNVTVSTGGTMFVDSATTSINALNGAGTVENGETFGAATLLIGEGNGSGTFSGTIINNGSALAVTKSGTGTETFSGLNSYTGATTINGGTLAITGSLASAVSVNGGGTLAGSGTISGLVTVAGGTTAPAEGILNSANGTIGILTLSGGLKVGGATGNFSILDFDAGSSGADLLALGSSTFTENAGGASINITSLGGVSAGSTFNLLTYTGAAGAGFATGSGVTVGGLTLADPSISFGITGSLNVTGTAVQLVLSGAAAPATAYWSGVAGATWSGTNGGGGNFTTDAAGTSQVQAYPGVATAVIFSGSNAQNFTNTLGASFDVGSVTFNGTNNVIINPDGNKLSIEAGGLTVNSGAGAVTIGANVGVGQSQAWVNNSSNALTISGTVSGAGTLTLNGGVNVTGPITDGTSPLSLTFNQSGVTVLNQTETYSGTTTINTGTLQIGNGGTTGSIANTASVTGSSGAMLAFDQSGSATFNSAISGSLGVLQEGSGSLTLGGASTYTGGTVIGSGTLAVNSTSGAGAGTITLNNASTGSSNTTLQLGVSGGTYANAITVANQGSGVATIQYTPNSSSASLTTGTITLNGPATISAPNITGYLQFNSVLTGTGALTIGSTDSQRLFLFSPSGGYTGNITIASGGLLEPRAALSATGGNNITVQSGGILQIFAANASINALNGAGTVQDISADIINGTRYLTIGIGNGSGTFSGAINDNGDTSGLALIKSGTGTETLSGASAYSGGTTISNGTVILNNASAAGSGLITLNDSNTGANNTQLTINTGASISNAITVAGIGSGTATIDLLSTSNPWSSGIITLNGPANLTAPNDTGNLQFASALSGTAALTVSSNGGRFILLTSGTVDSGFTGAVVVSNNTVFEPRDQLSASTGNSVNVMSGGVLQIVFANTAIDALNGAGTVRGNTFDGGGTDTLTVGKANGSGTFTGSIIDNGHTLAVTKVGTGTETFSGINNYSGGTTVNNGTLIDSGTIGGNAVVTNGTFNVGGALNGNAALTGGTLIVSGSISGNASTTGGGTIIDSHLIGGNVTIAGGSLEGAGTVAGNVIIGTGSGAPSSSIISPSLGVPTSGTGNWLTVGSLTLNSDAVFKLTINSDLPSSDAIIDSGALNLSGSLIGSDVGNSALATGDSVTLLIASYGTLTGNFANLQQGGLINIGQNWFTIDYNYQNENEIALTAAVPEPGTWGLMLGGFGILVAFQRSRRFVRFK